MLSTKLRKFYFTLYPNFRTLESSQAFSKTLPIRYKTGMIQRIILIENSQEIQVGLNYHLNEIQLKNLSIFPSKMNLRNLDLFNGSSKVCFSNECIQLDK